MSGEKMRDEPFDNDDIGGFDVPPWERPRMTRRRRPTGSCKRHQSCLI